MTDIQPGRAPLPRLVRMPPRIARLPMSDRGYPVPWFVVWLDEQGRQVPRGQGRPEFRIAAPDAFVEAIRESRCWVCGEPRGTEHAFVIGPMCLINRISGDPPSHPECAEFAARACPFLVQPKMKRREGDLPDGVGSVGGCMVKRNPGVSVVWVTRKFTTEPDGQGGVVFSLGDPVSLQWFREGRKAKRAEVLESIESGLPILQAQAPTANDRRELDRCVRRAVKLVRAEVSP